MGRVISFFQGKARKAANFTKGVVVDRQARNAAEWVRDAASAIKRSGKYRHETFEEAVERLDLTEAQLQQREADLYRQHCILSGLALASLLFCAWAASPVAMINAAFVTAAIATKAWSIGFRRWQLEERALRSVREFMTAGGGSYRGFIPLVRA